jgi:hypothetical protein
VSDPEDLNRPDYRNQRFRFTQWCTIYDVLANPRLSQTRADQPFQTQPTSPRTQSTTASAVKFFFPSPPGELARQPPRQPPREQERARPPATQTGHQASKQPRRLSSPTGHPDGHHAVRRELAGRPPRRPLGAIGYRCDVVNYSTKNSGGHKVTAWGQQLWPMGIFALLLNFFRPYTDPPYSRPSMIRTLARHPHQPCIFSNRIRWLFFKFRWFDLTIDWMFHLRR